MPEQSLHQEPDWFSPPGNTIISAMKSKSITINDFAKNSHLSKTEVQALLGGNLPIDHEIAEFLSHTLGASDMFWMSRQREFELNLKGCVQRSIGPKVDEWLAQFPTKEMKKLGWIDQHTSESESLFNFFGIRSLDHWENKYKTKSRAVAFRKSYSLESNTSATITWLRQAERQAALIDCSLWNKEKFSKSLFKLRRLSLKKEPTVFFPELVKVCAQNGVALVFTKTPLGCKASGATCFLNDRKAMIVLSFRHKSDDHFWFSFFHEAGHLILHDKKALFIEDGSEVTDKEEKEANDFASNLLVPPEHRFELESLPARSKAIIRFAVRLGVSPGVIVGQLQYKRIISFNQMNNLKRRYTKEQLANIT